MTEITTLIENRATARAKAQEATQHLAEIRRRIADGDASVTRDALTDASAEADFAQDLLESAEHLLAGAATEIPARDATITRDPASEAELGERREALGATAKAADAAAKKLKRARAALDAAAAEDGAARRALAAAQRAGIVDLDFAEAVAETLQLGGLLNMPAIITHKPLPQPELWDRPVVHVIQEKATRPAERHDEGMTDAPASGKRMGAVALAWHHRPDDVVPDTEAIVEALRGRGWKLQPAGTIAGISTEAVEADGLRVDLLAIEAGWPGAPTMQAGDWYGLVLPTWVRCGWTKLGEVKRGDVTESRHGVRLEAVVQKAALRGGTMGVRPADRDRDEEVLPRIAASLIGQLGATGTIAGVTVKPNPAWASQTSEIDAPGWAASATLFAEVTTRQAA